MRWWALLCGLWRGLFGPPKWTPLSTSTIETVRAALIAMPEVDADADEARDWKDFPFAPRKRKATPTKAPLSAPQSPLLRGIYQEAYKHFASGTYRPQNHYTLDYNDTDR